MTRAPGHPGTCNRDGDGDDGYDDDEDDSEDYGQYHHGYAF